MIPLEINVVEKGLDRLLSQFQDKNNIVALLTAFLEAVQQAEDLSFQVLRESELPFAEGVQLDLLGVIFSVPRDGRNDEDYRNAIISNISVDTTKATIDSVLTVVKNLTQSSDVVVRENFYSFITDDPNRAYTNHPIVSYDPLVVDYDPTTNFPAANVPYDDINTLWSKPNANVIVEVTAIGETFTTIPSITRLSVQDTVGAGILASTVMMKKDFYMTSLVEGTVSIQSGLLEVDDEGVIGQLAYTTSSLTPTPAGNIVALYATDLGVALSTDQNRFRENGKQQPEPTLIQGYVGSSLSILNDYEDGVDYILVDKTLAGSENIETFDIVAVNGFSIDVQRSVIISVGEMSKNGTDYWKLNLFTPLAIEGVLYTAVVQTIRESVDDWNIAGVTTPLLVQDEDGEDILLLDYAGTGLTEADQTENNIGILMEIRHD